jgi:hypothetical protein
LVEKILQNFLLLEELYSQKYWEKFGGKNAANFLVS